MTYRALKKKILKRKPIGKFLTNHEKSITSELVNKLADLENLGAALDTLWAFQKKIGFVLGTPIRCENTTDDLKFLIKNIGPYQLVHSTARSRRRDIEFLQERGIIAKDPRFVYEHLEGLIYTHYPSKNQGFEDKCFLCSSEWANPNEVLLRIVLSDAEFVYGANYATLGFSHFTVWTKIPILQKYWPMDTLTWLCTHGDRVQSTEFSTFFNGLGAGNSIRHFHYQTLKEKLPILDSTKNYAIDNDIWRLEWPMPAYGITLEENRDRTKMLSHFDTFISSWLEKPAHTLNLIHGATKNNNTKIIFIPRIDEKNKRHPKAIHNDFGGCEVSGRINIENLKEWDTWRSRDKKEIDALYLELAPSVAQIEKLESKGR